LRYSPHKINKLQKFIKLTNKDVNIWIYFEQDHNFERDKLPADQADSGGQIRLSGAVAGSAVQQTAAEIGSGVVVETLSEKSPLSGPVMKIRVMAAGRGIAGFSPALQAWRGLRSSVNHA